MTGSLKPVPNISFDVRHVPHAVAACGIGRDHDPPPPDHRAHSQGDGHCDLDPPRDEFRRMIEMIFI